MLLRQRPKARLITSTNLCARQPVSIGVSLLPVSPRLDHLAHANARRHRLMCIAKDAARHTSQQRRPER